MSCWQCHGHVEVSEVVCPACKSLQPVQPMSPFARLGFPPQFDLDGSELERAWLRASRVVHPDRWGNKSSAERRSAAEHSAALNDAYRILKDPLRRAEWLLRSHATAPADATQDLLMALMDAREEADDIAKRPAVAERARSEHILAMARLAQEFSARNLAAAAVAYGEARMWGRLCVDLGGALESSSMDR
jgi:molecular chaperone HscB